MKRRHERSERMRAVRLWDWSDATKAVPYLRSVIASLREHWLEVLNADHRLRALDKKKGPARRERLLEVKASQDERERAHVKFDDALEELNSVDVYLLDPVQGLALIPFRKEDDLAWYVFDCFADDGLIGWRYEHDPIVACRPLKMLERAAVSS
jgi:hypothetical protein